MLSGQSDEDTGMWSSSDMVSSPTVRVASARHAHTAVLAAYPDSFAAGYQSDMEMSSSPPVLGGSGPVRRRVHFDGVHGAGQNLEQNAHNDSDEDSDDDSDDGSDKNFDEDVVGEATKRGLSSQRSSDSLSAWPGEADDLPLPVAASSPSPSPDVIPSDDQYNDMSDSSQEAERPSDPASEPSERDRQRKASARRSGRSRSSRGRERRAHRMARDSYQLPHFSRVGGGVTKAFASKTTKKRQPGF
jgi:hypothetical protein